MKPKILLSPTTGGLKLSLLFLVFALMGVSCQEDNLSHINYEEGYITGWFIGQEVDSEGQSTGKDTKTGYCILLEDSENANSNQPMDFYAFGFPDTSFSFPDSSMFPLYNTNNCGPYFFPDSLITTYKFKFDFEPVGELDKVNFTMWCYQLLPTFDWEKYEQVILNSIIIE